MTISTSSKALNTRCTLKNKNEVVTCTNVVKIKIKYYITNS